MTIQPTKADRKLAKELGVQAGVVAQLRAEHGADKVREKLGFGAPPAPEPEPNPAAPTPAFVNLRVLRRNPNPIWITCASPQGVAVPVQVRRNNRLRPGMILQCRQQDTEWKCVHAGFAPV